MQGHQNCPGFTVLLPSRTMVASPGQVMPEITDEYAESVSERYIELYEHIIGEKFVKEQSDEDLAARIERNVLEYLKTR